MKNSQLAEQFYKEACDTIKKVEKTSLQMKKKHLTEQALTRLRLAYEQGSADAAYLLGIYYDHGFFGTEVHYPCEWETEKEALEWFEKAANLGHVKACETLGCYYYEDVLGRTTSHTDYDQALNWFRKADELGHSTVWIRMVNILSNKQTKPPKTEDSMLIKRHPALLGKQYPKELFDLLVRHIPTDAKTLRTWEYAYLLYITWRQNGSYIETSPFEPFMKAKNRTIMYHFGVNLKVDDEILRELTMPAAKTGDDWEDGYRSRFLKESREIYVRRVDSQDIPAKEAFGWYEKHKNTDPWAFGRYALCYYYGTGVAEECKKAFALLLQAVERFKSQPDLVDPEIHVILGDCYYYGYETATDYAKAREHYEKTTGSYELDEELSRLGQLGYCYWREKRYEEAFASFQNYVDYVGEDDPWAMGMLGGLYYNGQGTEVNYDKAYELLRMAAEEGDRYALNFVGICYNTGHGVPENPAEAAKWYRKAADKEFSVSYSNLGYLYRHGRGVKKDLNIALDLYKQALQAGYQPESTRQIIATIEKEIVEETLSNISPHTSTHNASTSIPYEKSTSEIVEKSVPEGKEEKGSSNTGAPGFITSSARQELDGLIGLDAVKKEIGYLEAGIFANAKRRELGLPVNEISRNMVFTGNAGTGKTTVARIMAEIFRENGLLATGQLIETDRGGLIDQYIGGTAKKTEEVFKKALGGVLFIDEAYGLTQSGNKNDFGPEAIATLIKLMEDHKNELVVIVAGYEKEMKQFIDSNPGIKSRFTTYIHFPDYTPEEMQQIFDRMLVDKKYILAEDAKKPLMELWEASMSYENAGNGRFVRNVFELMQKRQQYRTFVNRLGSTLDFVTFIAEDIPEIEELLRD